MIIFTKIRFKNILSYSNSWQEFNFEPGISRIIGQNGAGKSTIINSLYFSLFGKTYTKIKLEQLINSINKKELKTELFFTKGKDSYIIKRGLKPNYFFIYKNNDSKPIPLTSTTKSYQQLLEEILGFNENLFNQISLKSISRDFSFLALSKGDKRKIVENIFDIEFFTHINSMCKVKIDKIDYDISLIKKDIEYNELLIEQENINLNNLNKIKNQILSEQEKIAEESSNLITVIEKENILLNEKINKISSIEEKYKKNISSIKEIKDKEKKSEQELYKIQTNYSTLIKQQKVFETNCGLCPNISKFINQKLINDLNQYENNIKQQIDSFKHKLQELNINNKKMESIIQKKNILLIELSNNITKINEIKKQAIFEVKEKIEIDISKLKQYQNNIIDLNLKYNNIVNLKLHYYTIKNLCSDEGIKSFIIKKYLPYINKFLNSFLQKFHTDILFYFDSEFNEIIGTKFKEQFTYESFSEGQKRRIDLAILFTFMQFCKARSQKANSNILLLDEISSMLDSDGENYLYDILNKIYKEENKCIITISHSMSIDPNKIKNLYQVNLEKGFSYIKKILN